MQKFTENCSHKWFTWAEILQSSALAKPKLQLRLAVFSILPTPTHPGKVPKLVLQLYMYTENQMEYDLDGRQPQWKTPSMENNINGRQPRWKMIWMEDDLNGRSLLLCLITLLSRKHISCPTFSFNLNLSTTIRLTRLSWDILSYNYIRGYLYNPR